MPCSVSITCYQYVNEIGVLLGYIEMCLFQSVKNDPLKCQIVILCAFSFKK